MGSGHDTPACRERKKRRRDTLPRRKTAWIYRRAQNARSLPAHGQMGTLPPGGHVNGSAGMMTHGLSSYGFVICIIAQRPCHCKQNSKNGSKMFIPCSWGWDTIQMQQQGTLCFIDFSLYNKHRAHRLRAMRSVFAPGTFANCTTSDEYQDNFGCFSPKKCKFSCFDYLFRPGSCIIASFV